MKTYVVDMNVLQCPDFAAKIRAEAESRFVIPDVALVEMCKHEDCRLTMKLALQVFSPHIDQVAVSFSVGEISNTELNSRCPSTPDGILSSEFTSLVGNLITDLAKDENDKTNDSIQKRFSDARESLLGKDLDAANARLRTEQLLEVLHQGLRPKLIASIRSPNLSWPRFLAFVQVMSEIFFLKMLKKDHGMEEIDALRFIARKPMYLRYNYLLARHCLITIRNGGNVAAAGKELNHQLDLDYVLIASYFDGLLSQDKKVNEAHRDLLAILSTSSGEARERAMDWFEEIGPPD